jgi:hypothetical protein
MMQRSDASTITAFVNSSKSSNTGATVQEACDRPIYILARNAATVDSYSDANLAFACIGQHLTDQQWEDFRALVDAFQISFGRANP